MTEPTAAPETAAAAEPEPVAAVPETAAATPEIATAAPAETGDAVPATPGAGLTTDITAGPGGVMTNEVGVVTGDLTVRTEVGDDGKVQIRVQYKDADEWYKLTGGKASVKDPADAAAIHKIVVGILNRPEG